MVTKSWKLEVNKDGVLTITYLSERSIPRTASPSTDNVLVRGSGVDFEIECKRNVLNQRVGCPFKALALKERQPLPVAKMLELGTFNDAAVRRLRSHILGFVYEFVAGVCYERNPVIVKKVPFSIDDLFAKYPRFASQLSLIDWHSTMEMI
ncbi:MAG: hypothetical protein NC123_17405 [Butyrivibrio sp.]|nr:hypothetical protein [Butyrivibrio sp.]